MYNYSEKKVFVFFTIEFLTLILNTYKYYKSASYAFCTTPQAPSFFLLHTVSNGMVDDNEITILSSQKILLSLSLSISCSLEQTIVYRPFQKMVLYLLFSYKRHCRNKYGVGKLEMKLDCFFFNDHSPILTL